MMSTGLADLRPRQAYTYRTSELVLQQTLLLAVHKDATSRMADGLWLAGGPA